MFDGLKLATTEALICFKALAWLDMTARKEPGEKIDSNKINKHKTDIFRLGATLAPADIFELPGQIKEDMLTFITKVSDKLPGKEIFSRMGMQTLEAGQVLKQLIISFKLNE